MRKLILILMATSLISSVFLPSFAETAKIFKNHTQPSCQMGSKAYCQCFKKATVAGCRIKVKFFRDEICKIPHIISLIKFRAGGKLESGIEHTCYEQFHTQKAYAHCVRSFNYFLQHCRGETPIFERT